MPGEYAVEDQIQENLNDHISESDYEDEPENDLIDEIENQDFEFNGSDEDIYNDPNDEPTDKPADVPGDESVQEEQEEQEEFVDYEVPEGIPDDFAYPKDGFESKEKALDWYTENYMKMMDYYNSDSFIEQLSDNHRQQLIDQEEHVGNLNIINEALADNTGMALKKYFGEQLSNLGYKTSMDSTAMKQEVRSRLSSEFGNDYEKVFKSHEYNDPNTISGKMYARQQEVIKELEDINESAQEQSQANQPQSQEAINELLGKEYDEYFGTELEMSEERYSEFLKDANDYGQLTLKDLHALTYMDDYLEVAEEEGYERGKKELIEEIEKAGGKYVRKETPVEENFKSRELDEYDYYSNKRNVKY